MFFYNLGRPSQYQTVHKLCVGYNCQQSLRGLAPELLMSNPEVEQCTSIFQCIYYKYKDLNDLGGVCLEVNELGKQEWESHSLTRCLDRAFDCREWVSVNF